MGVQMQYRGVQHELNKSTERTEQVLVYRGAQYIRRAIEADVNQTTQHNDQSSD